MDPVYMVNEVKGPRSIVPRRRAINMRSSTPSHTQETHEEGKERPRNCHTHQRTMENEIRRSRNHCTQRKPRNCHMHRRHRINGKGDLEAFTVTRGYCGEWISGPRNYRPTRKHGESTRSPTMQGPRNHHCHRRRLENGRDGGRQERPLGRSSGGWHCAHLPPPPPPKVSTHLAPNPHLVKSTCPSDLASNSTSETPLGVTLISHLKASTAPISWQLHYLLIIWLRSYLSFPAVQ